MCRISKFGKNLVPIYFHFHLITVNVDRVYIYFVNEKTQKKTLNRCVCPQKNERQQKKPVTHGITRKKGRTRSSE